MQRGHKLTSTGQTMLSATHNFEVLVLIGYFTLLYTLSTATYFAYSDYSVLIGYELWRVSNQILLWFGVCVTGCCITVIEAHF